MKLSTSDRKKFRVKSKVKKVAGLDRLRLCIYRSTKNISAQIIDNTNNKTLVSATSMKKNAENKKKGDMSVQVGEILAKKALEKKITKIYFDRGSYRYHGRIKVFAETLRENGMEF